MTCLMMKKRALFRDPKEACLTTKLHGGRNDRESLFARDLSSVLIARLIMVACGESAIPEVAFYNIKSMNLFSPDSLFFRRVERTAQPLRTSYALGKHAIISFRCYNYRGCEWLITRTGLLCVTKAPFFYITSSRLFERWNEKKIVRTWRADAKISAGVNDACMDWL